jgi:hypothetical protein
MNGALLSNRNLESNQSDRKNYIGQLLELYRNTPGTLARVCREDRRLAAVLYDRGLSLLTLQKAFVLAAARRCFRAPDAPALASIRSLHYFVPVIDEVLANPPDDSYIAYLKSKLINRDAKAVSQSPLIPK